MISPSPKMGNSVEAWITGGKGAGAAECGYSADTAGSKEAPPPREQHCHQQQAQQPHGRRDHTGAQSQRGRGAACRRRWLTLKTFQHVLPWRAASSQQRSASLAHQPFLHLWRVTNKDWTSLENVGKVSEKFSKADLEIFWIKELIC